MSGRFFDQRVAHTGCQCCYRHRWLVGPERLRLAEKSYTNVSSGFQSASADWMLTDEGRFQSMMSLDREFIMDSCQIKSLVL